MLDFDDILLSSLTCCNLRLPGCHPLYHRFLLYQNTTDMVSFLYEKGRHLETIWKIGEQKKIIDLLSLLWLNKIGKGWCRPPLTFEAFYSDRWRLSCLNIAPQHSRDHQSVYKHFQLDGQLQPILQQSNIGVLGTHSRHLAHKTVSQPPRSLNIVI